MTEHRYRLVVLGSPRVGKTSIINRFLHNNFCEKYRETVDDLLSHDFRVQGEDLHLEIHDTNFNFPDMRKVAILSAHAIMLVFAIDDVTTFKEMSDLWREVCMYRPNISAIPIIIVGNKSDVENKKIYESTALAFTSRLHVVVRYLEVSAKNNKGIRDIFTTLLDLSGFLKNKEKLDAGPLETSSTGNPLLLYPQEQLKRNRSLRARSATRKERAEESSPRRSNSLIRRTKHLSLRTRRTPDPSNDDETNNCKVQ